MKPPETTATVKPEPLQRAHQGARTGRQPYGGTHLVQDAHREPGEGGHPGAQALGEVEVATHGGRGHLGDLGLRAGVPGQQVDHLVLDQGGVHVHDHQPATAAGQSGRGDGDVDPANGRLECELGAQGRQVSARDVELDRGDRVSRQPPDPVDVGAVRRDPCGDCRNRAGQQRRTDDDHDSSPTAARRVVPAAGLDGDLHAQRGGNADDHVAQTVVLGSGGQQQGQGQMPAHDDLFEIEDLGPHIGDGVEQRARHAGPVVAGDSDQEGVCRGSIGSRARRKVIGARIRPVDSVSPCERVSGRSPQERWVVSRQASRSRNGPRS